MSPTLECILAVFIITLIIAVVIITIYIVKLMQELTLTMTSIKALTDMAKQQLTPALESVNSILKTVNNVSNATNKQFELIKKILTTLLGASLVAINKGGFLGGLMNGFNIFRKKRR